MTNKRKVFTPQKAQEMIRTSVRVSKKMAEDVNQQVLRSGHNKRERSAWIVEALSNFIENEDAAMLVSEEFFEPPQGGSTTLSLTIPINIEREILRLLENIRTTYHVDKERSAVIRAALMTRVSSIKTPLRAT